MGGVSGVDHIVASSSDQDDIIIGRERAALDNDGDGNNDEQNPRTAASQSNSSLVPSTEEPQHDNVEQPPPPPQVIIAIDPCCPIIDGVREELVHDIERQCLVHGNDSENNFRNTCRFVLCFGFSAYKYGCAASGIEEFLKRLVESFGYGGIFRVTNTELFCCFWEKDPLDQVMSMVDLREGNNLHKLGRLNEVAKEVIRGDITQLQALNALEEIDKAPDPWSIKAVFASFVLTGGSLPVVFRGSWWDMLMAGICSIPVFFLMLGLPESLQKTQPFLSTLVSTVIASLGRRFVDTEVHTGLVVLSAVIILVPGYSAFLGVCDILTRHITAGLGRLTDSLVVLALLAAGGWLGSEIMGDLDFTPYDGENDTAVPQLWLLLFGPILMICLCIQFQTSYRDIPWSIMNLTIAFVAAYVGSLTGKKNAGVFLASILVTAYAQVWSNWKDRPQSIVLLPSLVLLVSGSIGFRGLVSWSEGEREVGMQQFVQMFVVAFFMFGGLYVGKLFIRSHTTL